MGRELGSALLRDLRGALRDLVPIALVVGFFQAVVIRSPLPDLGGIMVGAAAVVVGLALFIRGLELGLFPIGEVMALGLARKGSLVWLVLFAFTLGFSTTVAEPALIAIADEAAQVAALEHAIVDSPEAMDGYAAGLRLTVGLSVGVAIVVGVIRIVKGWPIQWLIIGG